MDYRDTKTMKSYLTYITNRKTGKTIKSFQNQLIINERGYEKEQMVKRKKSELVDALKASDLKTDWEIKDAEITEVKDVKTKFSDNERVVISFQDVKDDVKFAVFVNQKSLNNLIDAFGEDDKKWIGEHCKLSLETDEKFGKKMIVIEAK